MIWNMLTIAALAISLFCVWGIWRIIITLDKIHKMLDSVTEYMKEEQYKAQRQKDKKKNHSFLLYENDYP